MSHGNTQYLTTGQAGEQIGKGAASIRHGISKGEIPAVNVAIGGGRPTWRIPKDLWEQWLESRATKPRTTAPTRRRRKAGDVIKFY